MEVVPDTFRSRHEDTARTDRLRKIVSRWDEPIPICSVTSQRGESQRSAEQCNGYMESSWAAGPPRDCW